MPTMQQRKVLNLLAKEWEHSGPPGILDISDIVAGLELAPVRPCKHCKRSIKAAWWI